jgi:hypothetical protein
MFYVRINKIKVFNNREGFLGLFNRAELRIYSHAAGYSVGAEPYVPPLTLADLIDLDDSARRQKLLDAVAVLSEAGRFAQSHSLEINGVKDNQTLTFIGVGGVVVSLLRQKLKANKDDLVGYRQATLNRAEHYPHGTRDHQDVYDNTGNIQLDYTLFGFDKTVEPDSEFIIDRTLLDRKEMKTGAGM